MRAQCSIFIATSLDRFIARSDGRPADSRSWSRRGEDCGYKHFFGSIDTLVIGRKTYETALGFDTWPYAGALHRPHPREGLLLEAALPERCVRVYSARTRDGATMKRVFISYRRGDTKDWVYWLTPSLDKLFPDKVFLDIDRIALASNFRDTLEPLLVLGSRMPTGSELPASLDDCVKPCKRHIRCA